MLTADECQRLFAEHLDWSKVVAKRVHGQLPPSFLDLADLEQEAAIALWEQVQRYDPSKNNNVRGFAYLAVRGAVLMSVRRKHYREATNEELEPTHAGARDGEPGRGLRAAASSNGKETPAGDRSSPDCGASFSEIPESFTVCGLCLSDACTSKGLR